MHSPNYSKPKFARKPTYRYKCCVIIYDKKKMFVISKQSLIMIFLWQLNTDHVLVAPPSIKQLNNSHHTSSSPSSWNSNSPKLSLEWRWSEGFMIGLESEWNLLLTNNKTLMTNFYFYQSSTNFTSQTLFQFRDNCHFPDTSHLTW